MLTIALPMFFAISSLTVITIATFADLPSATIFLAGGTLILVVVRVALSFRDALDLGQAQGEARTDDLTGLGNRRALYEYLSRAIEARDDETQIAVLLLDLDRFKEVNDSFGHQAGDRILERIGPRMQMALRRGDFVARLGGDEFVVVLHSDLERAVVVAQRLRAELTRPFEIDDLHTTLDASIGIALCPRDSEDPDRLLQQADVAMYAAKEARSGNQIYEVGTDIGTRLRTETVQGLRRDVETEAIVLHYQPKIELPSEAVVGVEALVRWDHPVRGLVYPDHFLPLVEQAGLMQLLTKNVLNAAIQQCATWRDEGLDLTISVNLSPSDLRFIELPSWVSQTLAQAGLPSDRLQLELTEGTLMIDPDRGRKVLEQLRDIGVGISIDDFGTGHSSLAYLQDLPVNELKIDRSFVMRLGGNASSASIVRSTIDLAHSLELKLVAEGVESQATLEQLSVWGCDLAQGYHIGRALPTEQLTPWLHERLNNRLAENTIAVSS